MSDSDTGLVTVRCARPVRETTDRLAEVVAAAGLTVFARIDHGANAVQAGMELRPTELLIFGNPRGGTPLMQDQQTAGIDLPVKALVWEDAAGTVWLTYNDAEWVARRHGLGPASQGAVEALGKGLAAVAEKATAAEPA